ncbi:MAG: DUF559 domain-containing protein [Candidatus Nanopelagicales bacterium]
MPNTIRWEPPKTPFTPEDVEPLGVTRAALRTAVARERVVVLGRGVFVNADALPTDDEGLHLMHARAQQLLRPRIIASHETAALAWGLPLDDPHAAALEPPSFIAAPGAGVRSLRDPRLRITVRDLPASHRAPHPSGLVVTTRARTAVDVAATQPLPSALITLDAAARQTLIERVGSRRLRDNYQKATSLAAARQPILDAVPAAATHRTATHLAELLPWMDPRRESPFESSSFGEMVRHGLPLPQMQVRISTAEGDFYPDFLWAQARLIGEADGLSKYVSPDVLAWEKLRQEALERMGFLVIRWGMRDIRRHAAELMARLAAAIEGRTAR